MARIVSYHSIVADDGGLTALYRSMDVNYPKFFKMDRMSKAGFLAAETVLGEAGLRNEEPKEDISIVLVNSTSSTVDDIEFQKSIGPQEYFPSPSLFVYTLSNVVCGEIAIRNRILGETSFYVQEAFDAAFLARAVRWAFADPAIKKVLCGWTECLTGDHVCHMMLVERENSGDLDFTAETIEKTIKSHTQMEELKQEIKKQIIESLNLDMAPEDIANNEPLFGDTGLGLDSVDALELIVIMEKFYGIKLTDPSQSKGILQSIDTMSEYVATHRTK